MKKTVYVFQCSNRKTLFGLTYDQMGSNLPNNICGGTWISFQTLHIAKKDLPFISGLTPKEIIDTLDEDGFFIQEYKVTFKEQIFKDSIK